MVALETSGTEEVLVTKSRETEMLKTEIKELITSANDEVLRDIASFDNHGGGGVTYEEACQLHFQSLKDLITQNDCHADWSKHYWYPMEAVELRAFVPQASNPISFGVAIALLLLDGLDDGGRDHMEARSSERYLQSYRKLPKEFSVPIFAGLNVLQEA